MCVCVRACVRACVCVCLESLIEQCNYIKLHSYLSTKPSAVGVHIIGHRSYQYIYMDRRTRPEKKQPIDRRTASKILRSSSSSFNRKQHCFFCAKLCDYDENKTRHVMEVLEMYDEVLDMCVIRDDAMGVDVKSRLMTCNDLVAEEAVYHV